MKGKDSGMDEGAQIVMPNYFISLHYLRNILAVAMKGKDSGMDEGAQIVMLLSA
jgi:hypothetical protein